MRTPKVLKKKPSLKQKRLASNAQESYWLYGIHAVQAALLNKKRVIHELYHIENIDPRTDLPGAIDAMSEKNIRCVDKDMLNHILGEDAVHQGVALRVAPLKPVSISDVVKKNSDEGVSHIMVLDQVTDPHNVGAILRSCAVFGACALMMTDRHAPAETGILAKTASGALEHVPIIRISNLAQSLEHLKKQGFWVVGLAEGGHQTICDIDWSAPKAIVMGAEGQGLRALTKTHCDFIVSIASSQLFSTLNVSNAAAVTLHTAFSFKKKAK